MKEPLSERGTGGKSAEAMLKASLSTFFDCDEALIKDLAKYNALSHERGLMKKISQILPASLILENHLKNDERKIERVTNSSVAIQPGDLFFAVRGTKVDGHCFVSDAVKKGAVVVVEDKEIFRETRNAILVRSVREALALAACNWNNNPSGKFRLVGVTGTNGKTTTAYLLRAIWNELNETSGSIGTVETLIADEVIASELTTPGPVELQQLFSRMVEKKVCYAVMEVSSIALDQYRTAGTHFETGVFTNFTLDHLDYHGSLDNYRDAKLKFFEDYPLETAVLNIDDPIGELFYKKTRAKKKLSFSLQNQKADFLLLSSHFTKKETVASLRTPIGKIDLQLKLIGRYNLYNCMGALAAIYSLGQDLKTAAGALSKTVGAPGRLQRVMEGENHPSIFVDYAHSDDALRNVLQSLLELKNNTGGSIITVFGCGGDRDKTKRPKMANVVSNLSDITIATSDNPRTEDPEKIIDDLEVGILKNKTEYYREVNRKKAIELALKMAGPKDLVLVAGKGHENYQIIGNEKFPFDDNQVIQDYYCALEKRRL